MRYSLLVTGVLLFAGCAHKPDRKETIQQIQDVLGKSKGTFAVAYKDLITGDEILINEHTLFHAASTMKTPVMVEVYRQAAAGKHRPR